MSNRLILSVLGYAVLFGSLAVHGGGGMHNPLPLVAILAGVGLTVILFFICLIFYRFFKKYPDGVYLVAIGLPVLAFVVLFAQNLI